MQKLIQMDKDQEQPIKVLLDKIGMTKYLPYFQMLINGEISPADVMKLMIQFYNVGHEVGFSDGFSAAYNAERNKLLAIQSLVHNLGS